VYDLFVNVYNRSVHRQLREVVSGWIEPGDKVLECACGTGMLTEVIAPRCKVITATDFSPKMLQRAAKKCAAYQNASFETANILDLRFQNDAFDVVVAANVIHLLDKPEAALREMARVCRPGGRLIIPTYVNKEEAGRFDKTIDSAGADFKHDFTYAMYERFFETHGYEVRSCELIDGRVPCAVAVLTV